MTTHKFIRKLLNLKGLSVTGFCFKFKKRQLHLWVKPYKNGCRCPHCNQRGRILLIMDEPRIWRDVPICRWSVLLLYRPREIVCRTHQRVQENIPWADTYARITYRFEYAMLIYCRIMTQKAAARLLRIAPSTLSDLLQRCIERIRNGHRIRALRVVGIDEISYAKGRKYATVVTVLERARVVWVGRGKGRQTIDRFFAEQLSDYQKKQIK